MGPFIELASRDNSLARPRTSARVPVLCASLLMAMLSASVLNAQDRVVRSVSWEADVRPVLKAHCFHCHGEGGEKDGLLDLRLRRLLIAGGESGPAIVPGQPESSYLLDRVRSGEMPPGDDRNLSADDIRKIEDWIAAGATTDHPEPDDIGDGPLFTQAERSYWVFQPIVRPAIPAVQATDQVRTPIDAFLLARLEAAVADNTGNGNHPFEPRFAGESDAATLLRRASFDLLGLPPEPDEVAEFLTVAMPSSAPEVISDDAWKELIDRLLASPHYGERWGRHWLDVAGYADSEGQSDEDRVRPHAWRYRDYVIRSFNADKPFDQFIREQLAGDEMVGTDHRNLDADAIEKLTATGFLRMAPDGTASGGLDQGVARNQVVADTLQIVGTSLLGLTINCAQCHDHRYDPIPQTDYYRMRAVFEPALDWKRWRTPPARQISLYTDADREAARMIEEEAAQVDAARNVKAEEYITRTLEEELLLVPDDVRDPLRVAYRAAAGERSPEQVALLKEYPSVQNISVGSLYLYDRRREERARRLDTEATANEQQFVKETAQAQLAAVPDGDRELVQSALQTAADQRSDEQKTLLAKYPGVLVQAATLKQFAPELAARLEADRATAAELRASKAADDLKRYSDQATEIRARKPVEGFLRALTEEPGHVPPTFLFTRGDHEQPGEQLSPGDLSILAGIAAEVADDDPALPTSGRRLAWANWLTSGRHPLVARVIVNRLWLHHFGRGLVNSPGDFGMLGERPTHPELLDWLADEFMATGWSVKHMHRLIMNSTAYRQTAARGDSLNNSDPDNRLYGRWSVQRLEAEIVRDAVLAASGKLNRKLYGEPVPVMEDEVGQIILGVENLDGERKPTNPIPLNGEEFRRSVYVQMRRTRTLSVLETFDAPTMSPNCERRSFSNVAQQSLLLMNSDFASQYSTDFAVRLINEAGPGIRDQIALAWTIAWSEPPSAEDASASEQYIERQRQALAASGTTPANQIDQTALATFCQALLSSSRFLYVD